MKIIHTFLSDASVTALGWTLVHSIWQGSLIALSAALIWYVSRKQSASLRYNFGIGFLALQVLASVFTFVYYYKEAAKATGLAVTANNAQNLQAVNWQNTAYKLSLGAKMQIWLQMHISELVICWLIGTALLLIRFAAGWVYTERLRNQSQTISGKEWRTRFGLLAARLNVSVAVEFRENARVLTPMVIGAFKPVILLPVGLLAGFPVSQIEAIIAHELAHIRRNDYLINMIQSVIEVFYFFHPALWWLSEKVRTEREHCCDDIALAICEDKMTLAHALVKVAEWQSAPALAMAFASKKPLLLQRVRRVLGLTPKPVKTFSPLPVMLIAISMVVGISMYAIGQNEKKEKTISRAKKESALKGTDSSKRKFSADTVIIGSKGELTYISHEDSNASLGAIKQDFVDIYAPAPDVNYGKIDTDAQGNVTRVTIVNNYYPEEDYAKIRARIDELQLELDKLSFEAEKLSREREKKMFEVERFNREMEKIEWAKQKAAQLRSGLTEKRSSLLQGPPGKGQTKLSDAEIEKQLVEFEEKIKEQEQRIVDYNTQLAQVRSEGLKSETPLRETEKEYDILESKMDVVREQLEAESRKLAKQGPPPPPVLKLSMEKGVRMAPPPPPVEPKPAIRKIKKAAPHVAPPPPVPAKVK